MELIKGLIILVSIYGILYALDYLKLKKSRVKFSDIKLNDEYIFQEQVNFEVRLGAGIDFLDGIKGKKAYIYKNLMRNWYSMLIGKFRYDEKLEMKLKKDWLEYLGLLEASSATRFLTLETDSSFKKEKYEKEYYVMELSYKSIEDGFAFLVGEDAIKELNRVRDANYNAFDRSGSKPMAQNGFIYFPVSISPYIEDLREKE